MTTPTPRRASRTVLWLSALAVGALLVPSGAASGSARPVVDGGTASAASAMSAGVATRVSPPVSAESAAGRTSAAGRRWVARTVAGMTLPEKVGQLFEINGYGTSVDDTDPAMVALNQKYYGVDTIAQLIAKYRPGGIIYFTWSNGLTAPAQVQTLSNGIQRVAGQVGARVPMVISIDQESGVVQRIGSPATVFPGNMPLGATRSVRLAEKAGRISGVELRAMGINVNNAPVIDVNLNPLNETDGIRAYGDRVPLVSALGAAQVRGYQTRQSTVGVGATAKHWPGFGAAPVNSDTGVAISPQTLAEVRRDNLPPFRAAMRAGVDRIMVTHILFPKITGSKIPTSLSPFWINGVLRRDLGYRGPLVTDALDAVALDDFSAAEVAVMAMRAGADQLLEIAQTPNDTGPADLVTAYPAILNAVRSGVISRARLDQSVARILELKWRLGLVNHALTPPDRISRVVGTPAHLATAQRIADRSITLLRNRTRTLPLRTSPGEKVLVTGFGQTTTATLGQDLAARGLTPQVLPTGSSPTDQTIAQAVAAARQNDLVVATSFNAWAAPAQLKLINALLATGTPVVVVGVGTPYDIAYLPAAPTFITGYGYQPPTIHAVVDAMFGDLRLTGRLPVTITEPPPSTDVLYPYGFRLPLRR